jgi:hypothetical protein
MKELSNIMKDNAAQEITLKIFEETMNRIQKGIAEIHSQGCDPVHAVNMIKFVGMGVLATSLEFMPDKDGKNSFAEALSGELFLHLKNYIEAEDGVVSQKIIIQ